MLAIRISSLGTFHRYARTTQRLNTVAAMVASQETTEVVTNPPKAMAASRSKKSKTKEPKKKAKAKTAMRMSKPKASKSLIDDDVATKSESLASSKKAAATDRKTKAPLGTATADIPTKASEINESIEFYNITHFLNENGTLPLPKSLSPSSIMEFEKCPQSYFFQYVLGLRQPRNLALAKGSMAHSALEQFLAIPERDRNLEVLHNFFRKAWSQHRREPGYKELFATVADEISWGQHALQLLSNYYANEPLVAAPNPVQRERWISAKLGTTEESNKILVRGIIDRLDLVKEKGMVSTRIVDYKTGCAPHLKYSPVMNEKIRAEAFDQLLIYALLMRKSYHKTPIRYLRLLYLQSVEDGPAVAWDYDLGEDEESKHAVLDAMEERILNVYRSIVEKLQSSDPFHAFAGCDRSFCYCHSCRQKFAKGLVWEPPPGP